MKVSIEGKNSFEDSRYVWEKIIGECERYKCRRILIVSDLKAFDAVHAIKFKDLFDVMAMPGNYKVAWVEHNPNNQKMVCFIETVCNHMGLKNVLHFYNEQLAKSWLKMGNT